MKYLFCLFALLLALCVPSQKPHAQVGSNHYYAWVAINATTGDAVHQYSVTDYDSNGKRLTYIAEWNSATAEGYGTSNPATKHEVTVKSTTATSAHYEGKLFQGSGGVTTPSVYPFALDISEGFVHFVVTDPKGNPLIDYLDVPDPGSVINLSS